jgi:hypothetical protein
MAKHPISKRDEPHEVTRRALIKWSVAAGAALGVSRAKIFEILEKTAGKGVAFAASEAKTARFVGISANNGGLAWFQQKWPDYDPARARNPNFAYVFTGQEVEIVGTTKPLLKGPGTPWADLPAARQMTIFNCGSDRTHNISNDTTTNLNGANIMSAAAALQVAAGSSSVVPFVSIGGLDPGTAQGAPTAAAVGSADGIVGLFNSAASRAGGLLTMTKDANLYTAHYQAFAQLNRAANLSTTKASYVTASNAAQFLGLNLAEKLQITPADLLRYGVTGGTPNNVAAIARSMIVTVKAFKMGLMNSVVFTAFGDDPHGFNFTPDRPLQHKAVFDAFMKDLTDNVDDNTLKSLADDTVIAMWGDTTKKVLQRPGWPDGREGNTSVVYVYGAGHLKTGWFGGVDRNGNVTGFTNTGATAPYNANQTAQLATASIAYAIAKRDARSLTAFANGITAPGLWNALDQ